ncbi:Putative sodium-dependent excitatory amino acid transporter glt-4 [Eumeta japonica]|uniref:Amino acid transporter n=1 Tax=Eumeta variegata TaxID=151549 RepID=A0A4C1X0A2_EUMVA|nr:Putative sodium-dependent excitatory amino acid transporter glt-4 [Eumeta japonica]
MPGGMKPNLGKFLRENLLTFLTILGVASGTILGCGLRAFDYEWSRREVMYFQYPGELFLRMLKCLIVPLLVSSIVSAIGSLDLSLSGKDRLWFTVPIGNRRFKSSSTYAAHALFSVPHPRYARGALYLTPLYKMRLVPFLSESSGGSLAQTPHFSVHQSTLSSIRYRISIQDTGNALVTPLVSSVHGQRRLPDF